MKTYNLGKIGVLKDLKTEMVTAGIAGLQTQSFRGSVKVSGENIQEVEVILYNLGFRLPTIKECVYIYNLYNDLSLEHYGYNRRFWVDTEMGAQILLIINSELSIWSNATETLLHTLFAVRDI
jgi:hypothetical protein